MTAPRFQLADELLRRFAAALRSAQLYSKGHPLIARNLESLSAAIQLLHGLAPSVVIGLVGDEVIVDDMPIAKADAIGPLARRLQQSGIERITFDRGVSAEELASFVEAVTALERRDAGRAGLDLPDLKRIRVGRVVVEQKVAGDLADMATIKKLYNDAVSVAGQLWETAQHEGKPDAAAARTMIDGLAQAVAQNRTALLALTTLKNYDNYTFTHMVNVSILTMGQARTLGIDGPLLREFGLAALMHDIGKVRTPLEILHKPDKLSDAEFEIMKRHVVEGAEILRATRDIPTLAPVPVYAPALVTFFGVGAAVGIGAALAAGRIGWCPLGPHEAYRPWYHASDRYLRRRFVQLVGIYPAGNLVRLNTGETAVVLKVHAPDPYRPKVRVLTNRQGRRLDLAYEWNLWEPSDDPERPSSIVAPLDPSGFDFDPLMLL